MKETCFLSDVGSCDARKLFFLFHASLCQRELRAVDVRKVRMSLRTCDLYSWLADREQDGPGWTSCAGVMEMGWRRGWGRRRHVWGRGWREDSPVTRNTRHSQQPRDIRPILNFIRH